MLPFQNLGGDAETEFFLDSVAQDLTTELARARWFSIVARNTAFTSKGRTVDEKQIARELGVRYFVEGSLRKAGNRVCISCQLCEAESGQHIWADRCDGTLEDSFDLRDRITESLVGSGGPVLRQAATERARRKPEANLDAYDLVCRSFPPTFAETADDNEKALVLLTQALEMSPESAIALGAWCLQQRPLLDGQRRRPMTEKAARLAIAGGEQFAPA